MIEPPKLPLHTSDKLYFRIGEISRIARVPTSALRFWESQFPGITPQRSASGQRLYSRHDLDLILEIKNLLYERKFTIEGARDHLKTHSIDCETPCTKNDLIQSIRSELEKIRNLLK